MASRTAPWPAGVPCWVDLMASDVMASARFYGEVLGWETQDTSEEYGGYVIAHIDGVPAAGIGPTQPGARTAWTMYLASDDADATQAKVAEAGGTVVLSAGDVGDLGRMFLAVDPTGAFFGVWQAGTHIGAGLVNSPGGLTWEDLRSPDPDTARAFYDDVFGYRYGSVPGAGDDYTTFARPDDEIQLGGMGGMFGQDDAAPHWLVYFGVEDADAAASAVSANGGTVLVEPFDTPFGLMAGVSDPDNAVFWINQNTGRDLPDRSD